jgi:type VI protein secretion system component Hcp
MSTWIEFSSPIGKWCEAQSVSPGMTSRAAAGGPARKAQSSDFSVTRVADALSSQLWLHAARGTVFGLVTIEFYKNPGDILYLSYALKDVVINSISSSGGGGRPMESLSLVAGSISWQYFKSDD